VRGVALVLLAAACDEPAEACCVDASPFDRPIDAGMCLEPEARVVECEFDLTGRAVDILSGAPATSGVVRLTTALDTNPPFPADSCEVLDEIPLDENGELVALGAPCDGLSSDPFVLVMLANSDLARVAMHHQIVCPPTGGGCSSWDVTLEAPPAAVASAWRTQLMDEGVDVSRGLVLVRYVERDGSPSEGVSADIYDPTLPMTLMDPWVRYVAADGQTLMPATTPGTTASGLALFSAALGDVVFRPRFSGRRFDPEGVAEWDPVPWITREGWIYFGESGRAR
jgi:hypothetical protein